MVQMDSSRSVVVLGVVVMLMLAQQHATAQGQGIYACWGGCYNECLLQSGTNPSQRLGCYWQCLGSCVSQPTASVSDNNYYCKLGCSMQLCYKYNSAANENVGQMKNCLENCSNNICNGNT